MRSQAWVDGALGEAEATGRLNGVVIEHFVGGGLPPPRLRSDQLRLMTRDGRDVLVFDKPDFKKRPTKAGQPYPNDEYTLAASPADVQLVARLVREAFRAPAPEPPDADEQDALHTEIIVSAHGRQATRAYRGGAPSELASLTAAARTLIERAKTQGVHEVKQ